LRWGGAPAVYVEYHSLDQPLQLRVTSPFGWEIYFENAIVFWPHRACGDDGLRQAPAGSRLRERFLTGESEVRAEYWKGLLVDLR
jgi:hypothetical protein